MSLNVPNKNPGDQLFSSEVNEIVQGVNNLQESGLLLSGLGDPVDSLGENGNYYLNTTDKTIFGPKVNDVWGAGLVLKGDRGDNGSDGTDGVDGVSTQWRTGSGIPSDSLGIDNDYYLNADNGDVYKKELSVYVLNANIKGADGDGSLTLDQVLANGSVTARDIVMQKATEQAFIFQRLGIVGITENGRFLVGRIVNGGINEPKFRIGFQDDIEYTTEVFCWEVEPSGTMASLRQVVGSHIEAFIGQEVNPMFRISSTDLGSGNKGSRLELGAGADNATDVFLEKTGANEFRIVLSGGTKQIWFADAIFTPSGIMQVLQDSATPSAAGAGTTKLYSRDGNLYQMDSSGEESILKNNIITGAGAPNDADGEPNGTIYVEI